MKPKMLTAAQIIAIMERTAEARRERDCTQAMFGGRCQLQQDDIDALLAEVKLLRSRPITDPHYNAIYDPED